MKKKSALKLRKNGFTLIELVVVFSVIAIISTLGVAAFVGYSRTQTLNQAAFDLSTTLSTAKSRASSQIKPAIAQCSGTSTLNGYSVTINIPAGTYSLNVVCSAGTSTLSTTQLPTGVTFNTALGSPPTTTTSVFISVLTSGVTGAGNIVLSGFSMTKTISINSTGVIK